MIATRPLLPVALLLALIFSSVQASADSSLSNRVFVDTRGPQIPSSNSGNANPLEGVPKLIDVKFDGHRLISHEMTKQSLPRPEKETVAVFLQIKIPNFSGTNGGWGRGQAGLGVFYGLEMRAFSALSPVDTIQYKFGGVPPNPDTPAGNWTPTTFNQVIDIPVGGSTCYFKINLGSGTYGGIYGTADPGPLKLSARFKSARLCTESGEPVTRLDPFRSLWIISHGKSDGEDSFRDMNWIVNHGARGGRQVVSLDWASGAKGEVSDLTNGRYFINLGRALGKMLGTKSESSKINWVGHSWGTYVGCETARSLTKIKRFTALDPALLAFYYDNKRVNFKKYSSISTGIKGGGITGVLGNEKLTQTCNYSIRLWTIGWKAPVFYHRLPRIWFTRSMGESSDPYWNAFKTILLREELTPAGLFGGVGKILSKLGKIDGFNLENVARTEERNGVIRYLSHQNLRARDAQGTLLEITLRKAADGKVWWRFEEQEE